jgi:molybdopterin synthase catalytic subunit
MVRGWITTEPIQPAELLGRVGSSMDGAVVLFVGLVRDHNEGEPVSGMTYEAYAPMAEKVLGQIAGEAAARLGTDRLVVVHRVGDLRVGDVSVAIAVSSPHRDEAFDAARYVIEEIKQRLPVWKREHYLAGNSQWLDGIVPPTAGDGDG